MSITIHAGTPDDIEAINQLDTASFGDSIEAEELAAIFSVLDARSFLLAMDGERIVGSAADYPFRMTVPGGSVDVPGVTWVAVDVTHRRRGVLRALMERQLAGFKEAGHSAAVLTASEGGIYGRFGYGIASHVRKVSVDRRRVALRTPGDASAVRRVGKDEARARLPELHERWCAQTSGALRRSEGWWDLLLKDLPTQRHGMSAQQHLVHEGGYVSYRVKTDWTDGDPRHLCWITDYIVSAPEAHRDLWQVLLGLDLVGPIESYRVPLDDPLPHCVFNGRLVKTLSIGDGLWLRPLDVTALLGSRTYALEVDLVLEVRDEMFGDGTFRLRGGPDGATCERSAAAADVRLDVAALGAAYLGGVRLAPLAAVGHVEGAHAAVARLDRALLADRLPNYALAF